MPNAEYPPLPEPLVHLAQYHGEWRETEIQCADVSVYTADQMHAYLATERQRIEREVMPFLLGIEHVRAEAILRAIRGENTAKADGA
jgi:hypothetical protein